MACRMLCKMSVDDDDRVSPIRWLGCTQCFLLWCVTAEYSRLAVCRCDRKRV